MMNKQRKTSHILNVFQYDETTGAVTLPSTLVLTAPASDDNSTKVGTTAWVRTYVTGLSYLTGNQSITVSGDATGSGTTSIALTLANTAVTPGTYGSTTLVPVVTVDSKGRITSVTTAAISGSLTFTGDVTGTGTTGTSTGLTLAASGVTAGTYTKVTVDSKGRVTVGASATTTDIAEGTRLYYTDARVGTYLTTNSYATQSYVNTQVSNLVAAAPATLDTLNELAAALGNDASFSTTISTALGNRLRVDINNQGLSATLQGYGRTNLGLGTAATANTGDFVAYRTFGTAANSAVGDFVAYRTFGTAANNNTGDFAAASHTHSIANVTGLQTALDGKQASLGYTPYNSTNPSGYISSYTETDTLASVTGRGATTTAAITVDQVIANNNGNGTNFKIGDDAWIGDVNLANTFRVQGVQNAANGYIIFGNGDATALGRASTGALTYGGNTVYHSGNLPTIPTNNNQLTNGAGYITSSSLSSYVPYTGATANIDTGGYSITAGAVTLTSNLWLKNIGTYDFIMSNGTSLTTNTIRAYYNTSDELRFYAKNTAGGSVVPKIMVGDGTTFYTIYHTGNIPTIPTNNNQLTNGAGYITSSGSISGSAGSVAWTNVTGRPTALSSFTNDLGNYGNWITSSASISGNAGSVTYLMNRTDSAAYPVLWGANYTNSIGTIAYSCAAVTIQSSTGTLTATTFSGALSGNATTASSISGYNNPTTGATANTIVYRDGSGHISGNYILGSYFNSSAGNSENPTIGQVWTQSTGDNYLRKSTPAHFISQLGLITTSNIGSQSVSYATSAGSASTAGSATSAGSATTATTATNLYGQGTIQRTSSGTSYGAMIQIRETAGASGNTNIIYAPAIGFHWGGVVASSIRMNAGGEIQITNNPGSAYEAFRAGAITGDSFNGPGTGLTGTASSLSVGYASRSDGSLKLWATSHPTDYYIVNNWTGTYWQLTTNHGSGVQVAYANSAGSASSASYASYLPTAYAGGQQTNPQVYFNNGIGLKAAMTGSWSVWSDTLWVNGYSGSDVKWMCALHFLRNSEPRMAISAQQHDSSSYGSYYEVITAYNIASQSVSYASTSGTAGNITAYTINQSVGSSNAPTFAGITVNGQTTINRHIDANTGWGSASGNTIFVGWGGGKVVLGNNANGGHDYARDITVASVVSTNPFFCYQDITAYSDARVKDNVEVINNAIEKIKSIRGVTYTRSDNVDKEKRHAGVIAQEVLKVLPEVVSGSEDSIYSVAYGNMAALFIEAIKEQQLQIEELKNKLDNVLSSR